MNLSPFRVIASLFSTGVTYLTAFITAGTKEVVSLYRFRSYVLVERTALLSPSPVRYGPGLIESYTRDVKKEEGIVSQGTAIVT